MTEYSEDWKEDCMSCWGKILEGKYRHWCADWDYLAIDETCHPFAYCNCEYDEWDMKEKEHIQNEIEKEMLRGMCNSTSEKKF